MKYAVLLLILVGFIGFAYASHNDTLHSDVNTTEEHYEIEIMGLKDEYVIGEQYSFYFVISGYGDECARINVSYPDENGRLNGWGSEPLCDPNSVMYDFETKYVNQQEHFGNIVISNPGTYTVTVTFDRPNKYFPTISAKEFRVVESIDEDSYKLPLPLKQFRTGIATYEIQCKDNLVLIEKHDGSPACVKPVTKQHLIDRNWGETKSLYEIEHNPKLIKQNIIRIEDGLVSLYPENMCASVTLDLPTEEDIQRYASDEKGLGDVIILQITDEDMKEIPIIQELIYGVHSIEFPYNKHSSADLDGLTFVEYEFFLMEKAIEKYGDSQRDYFIQLDNDYEKRFTDPAKQGFINHFESPVIVYNDAAYSVSGTNF